MVKVLTAITAVFQTAGSCCSFRSLCSYTITCYLVSCWVAKCRALHKCWMLAKQPTTQVLQVAFLYRYLNLIKFLLKQPDLIIHVHFMTTSFCLKNNENIMMERLAHRALHRCKRALLNRERRRRIFAKWWNNVFKIARIAQRKDTLIRHAVSTKTPAEGAIFSIEATQMFTGLKNQQEN